MNKSELIEFAKDYLGVQKVPQYIEFLLEGMCDARNRRVLSFTARQAGRATACKIVTAYTTAKQHDLDNSQSRSRQALINTTNGGIGEK